MGDTTKSPLKLQVFPQQKIKDLPKDQDIELTMVPKQVIQFQGISSGDSQANLTVTVDSTGRSNLHYTPSNCLSGVAACMESPGSHELWVPQVQNPIASIKVSGFSSPYEYCFPKSVFDPSRPLHFLMAEAKWNPLPSGAENHNDDFLADRNPEGMEDFFIAWPDNSGVLDGCGLKDGGHFWSDLSESQKERFRSLIKEAVSTGGALYDEKDLLKDFGFDGKFYLKSKDGKHFVIFKGYSGLRKVFRGTRYSLDENNARLSILTIKQGPLQAIKEGIPDLAKKGAAIGFLFMGAVNTWTWLAEEKETRFISDLIVEIGSDALKAVAGGVLAAVIAGFVSMAVGATLPVFAVVAGVAIIGVATGLTLDILDNKFGGTKRIKEIGRNVEGNMKDLWREFVEEPVTGMLKRCEWEIRKGYGIP